MNTRTLFLLLFLTLISLNLIGQERINRTKLTFDTTSVVFNKATGWAYNSILGEWIDYENVISANKENKEKNYYYEIRRMMSKTSQNFLEIQTKIVTYNGIKYYIIVVKKVEGEYEYPAIYEDWYEYVTTNGYIFTENEYKKILTIENPIILKTKKVISMGSKSETYNETVFLDLIQSTLSQEKYELPFEYTFHIMKSKEGKIRFYVPDHDLYSYNFNEKYFETDFENFSKLIIK